MKKLILNEGPLTFESVAGYLTTDHNVQLSAGLRSRVTRGRHHLCEVTRKNIPLYGVTTGFGDSVHRRIDRSQSVRLQKNLISYLLCGSGALLPLRAAKGTFLIRLQSLSRGHSGVTPELIDRMAFYLNRNWVPVIPREGSLGASGDLVPLAYLARGLQGGGEIYGPQGPRRLAPLLKAANYPAYTLAAKEGLALVNGTSAMTGLAIHNLVRARGLLALSVQATAWMMLCLEGRPEAFSNLVNDRCSRHGGQSRIAGKIRRLLKEESYRAEPLHKVPPGRPVQDRYSLRCVPQILGPVHETLQLVQRWLEEEINGVSDNPLLSASGQVANGGNFYGGYLSHSMDYLKISLAQLADLTDRQLLLIVDEKSNRGLPPNLADWPGLPENQRHLHHGLKGLHQAASALTSEIMALSVPNGIFSRSTESHNQDKVSLGMSAATQCHDLLDKLLSLQTLHLVALAQAVDLRHLRLRGTAARGLHSLVRSHVPFLTSDRETGPGLARLKAELDELFWRHSASRSDEMSFP